MTILGRRPGAATSPRPRRSHRPAGLLATLAAVAVLAPSAVAAPAGAEVRAADVGAAPLLAGDLVAAQVDTSAADDTYWEPALGLTGPELEDALHEIISTDVRRISYDEVWDALAVTDADPDRPGNVVLFYQGTSMPASNNGGGVDQWNREHVWAKSHGDFGTSTGPGTDLHHLRPTDVTVNSARGNLDFDDGGEEVEEAPGNYVDGDSWEPRDADKGDVARAIMYMSVRYEGDDGFADLEVNDATQNGSAPRHGRLSVLLQWHEQDPPSAAEVARNDVIFEDYQGNRNPFVDHPEWAADLWG